MSMGLTDNSQAARAGELDGRKGIPVWDDPEHAPFVRRLAAGAQQAIRRVEQKFDRADGPLKTRFNKFRDRFFVAERHRDEAQQQFVVAMDEHEQEYGSRPSVVRPASLLGYWAGMSLLVLLELPLNYVVFGYMGLLVPAQLLLAAGFGLLFMREAHVVGDLLHQRPTRHFRLLAQAAIHTVGPPIVMLGLAGLRESYAVGVQEAVRGAAAGLEGVPVFSISPAIGFWTFFGFNLLLYFLGVSLSYKVHEPLPWAVGILNRAKRRFDKVEEALTVARTRRVKNAQRFHSIAETVRQNCYRLTDAYNETNLRMRDVAAERQASSHPNRGQPLSFTYYPHVAIPEHLFDPETKLNWN
jgi:hypothetical protein